MADLIGVAQAAKEFGVHPQTIRRAIHAGRIKGYKRPFVHGFFVDRAELKGLAQLQTVAPDKRGDLQMALPEVGARPKKAGRRTPSKK